MKLQEEHDAKAAMYAEQQKQVTINHISGGFCVCHKICKNSKIGSIFYFHQSFFAIEKVFFLENNKEYNF